MTLSLLCSILPLRPSFPLSSIHSFCYLCAWAESSLSGQKAKTPLQKFHKGWVFPPGFLALVRPAFSFIYQKSSLFITGHLHTLALRQQELPHTFRELAYHCCFPSSFWGRGSLWLLTRQVVGGGRCVCVCVCVCVYDGGMSAFPGIS